MWHLSVKGIKKQTIHVPAHVTFIGVSRHAQWIYSARVDAAKPGNMQS